MIRYTNPFEGRQKRIALSGLFLFDPDVGLRLNGSSMRGVFAEAGWESLFKGIERALKLGKYPKRLIAKICSLAPPSLREELRAAFGGDAAAIGALAMLGPWQAYLLGSRVRHGDAWTAPAAMQFLCRVESASYHALQLCKQGDFAGASAALAADDFFKHFLSPAQLRVVAEAREFDDLIVVRAAVAMDVWLGMLAAADVEACPQANGSYGLHVMPGDAARNPTALLFDWLLKEAEVTGMPELLRVVAHKGVMIDGLTLGAWSRGTNFPRLPYVKVVADALLKPARHDACRKMLEFARHLNFIGYLAQQIPRIIPSNRSSIEAWMRDRYEFWLNFHRSSSSSSS